MQCVALHCIVPMDEQVTFRIPRELARALARQARERGVPKSQLVREALRGFLAKDAVEAAPGETWNRLAPFVGSAPLDHAAIERDALARQIRQHNWRD